MSNILTIVMRLIKYYLAHFTLEYVCNLQPDSFNSHRTKFFFVELSHDARMIGMFTELALIGEF